MTQLRKRVLEEFGHRNYSQATATAYIGAIRRFAEYFHRSPDQLDSEHIRKYQLYLLFDSESPPSNDQAADVGAPLSVCQGLEAPDPRGTAVSFR